jgi:hypothetical protein
VALESEQRACALAETISKSKTLSAEIKRLVAEYPAKQGAH